MKRDYLKSIGLTDEQINLVMEQNGVDINTAKATLNADVEKYKGEAESYQAKATEWENKFNGQAAAYKDYDLLKKFHEDAMAKQEKQRQSDYVKSLGCKYPELIVKQLDFSKATYDEDKKIYTGLDEQIKTLKASYGDMFGTVQHPNPNPQPTQPSGGNIVEQYLKEHPEMANYMPK